MFKPGDPMTEAQAHALNTLRSWFNSNGQGWRAPLEKAAREMVRELHDVPDVPRNGNDPEASAHNHDENKAARMLVHGRRYTSL